MQKEDPKELFKKLGGIRSEITVLKSELNETDEKKEEWFKKKEGCSNQIRNLIKRIKEDKAKRNSLTKKVKEDKKQREMIRNNIYKNWKYNEKTGFTSR